MARYRKLPVEIEAVQLTWKTWDDLCEMAPGLISMENPGRESELFSDTCGELRPYIELDIPTSEGVMLARHGDWIIKGVKGEYYPCKPDVFAITYERIADMQEDKDSISNWSDKDHVHPRFKNDIS